MTKEEKIRTARALRKRGFDVSTSRENPEYLRVTCSQCQSMIINGIATHEKGCPNSAESKRRIRV